MANMLVSSWAKNVDRVPENYAMPPHKRPIEVVSIGSIPVIDLAKDSGLVQEILEASQEFGAFQIINHGISERLMDDMMDLFKELFDISFEDRELFFSEMSNKNCIVFPSGKFYSDDQEPNYWKDFLMQPVFPIETLRKPWIDKPARYRELVISYSEEIRSLGIRILELIGEGLGLEKGYFGKNKDLSKGQVLGVNHSPPCPDPSSALGTHHHCDPNLITFLQQQVYGLQIFKDGHWIGVQPLPYAFVVNIGYTLQVISNNKLVGCEHRAVTNTESDRTSIVTFIYPSDDCIVEPAKALAVNGAVFRGFKYPEFRDDYHAKKASLKTLDAYKLQP